VRSRLVGLRNRLRHHPDRIELTPRQCRLHAAGGADETPGLSLRTTGVALIVRLLAGISVALIK
jgi:hypothetical protein